MASQALLATPLKTAYKCYTSHIRSKKLVGTLEAQEVDKKGYKWGGREEHGYQTLFSFGFFSETSLVVRLTARLFFLALITTFQPRQLHIWTKSNVNTPLLSPPGRGRDEEVTSLGERCLHRLGEKWREKESRSCS